MNYLTGRGLYDVFFFKTEGSFCVFMVSSLLKLLRLFEASYPTRISKADRVFDITLLFHSLTIHSLSHLYSSLNHCVKVVIIFGFVLIQMQKLLWC